MMQRCKTQQVREMTVYHEAVSEALLDGARAVSASCVAVEHSNCRARSVRRRQPVGADGLPSRQRALALWSLEDKKD
jgi:hypothetical protein